jgi:hypothetical protein
MITLRLAKADFPAVARHVGIASLLLFAATGAQAADDDDDDNFNAAMAKERALDPTYINDWRLGYSMLPATARINIIDKSDQTNPGNFRADTNWDLSGRTGVMWMTPWSGLSYNGDFILGLEVSTNHTVIESNTAPSGFSLYNYEAAVDFRSYQLTVHPGLAWLLDDGFHIEINPYFGAGVGILTYDLAGASSAGLYWEVGVRGAAYYTWKNGIQLGMQMGYMYGTSKSNLDGASSTFDTDLTIQGMTLGLQLGLRL